MDRYTALLAALVLATACATGRPQSQATPATAGGGTPSARLHALADEMWDTTLAVSPTIGTFLGLPGARHDRMDDTSFETVRRLQDLEFHQHILEDGTVPLPLLGEKIDRWMASAR